MTIEHIETAIIGAGQAGLATAYHLQRQGRPCLILDGNEQVGDNWRAQWDSLRLYSPAVDTTACQGCRSLVRRWSYPTKDQVADYLAAYAERFELPVRTLARVDRLQAVDGKYVLQLGADSIIADNVVVATGTFGRTPRIPDFALGSRPVDSAAALQRIPQAGAAESWFRCSWLALHNLGTDIAFEVASTHPTVLAGRDPGEVPGTAGPLEVRGWSRRPLGFSPSTCSPG